jgi:hypothetical protein
MGLLGYDKRVLSTNSQLEFDMDRYELENASSKVEGYLSAVRTSSKQSIKTAFEKAKAECVLNYKKQIQNICDLTFEQFMQNEANKKTLLSSLYSQAQDSLA